MLQSLFSQDAVCIRMQIRHFESNAGVLLGSTHGLHNVCALHLCCQTRLPLKVTLSHAHAPVNTNLPSQQTVLLRRLSCQPHMRHTFLVLLDGGGEDVGGAG